MSRYHWHRVFKAMTGETLAEVVRRLRLSKAANALAQDDTPVRTIADQMGFKNLASFSRAFKAQHGVSPNQFREQGAQITSLLETCKGDQKMFPVDVKEFGNINAAGVLHIGPYQQIGHAFKELGGVLAANSLMSRVDGLFAIYRDAPGSKPGAELRSHVAVSLKEGFPDNLDGLEYFEISSGRYVVLEHRGPYQTLKSAYDWLYGTWLPGSGEEPKDEPPLEVYVNDPRTTRSQDLRTDIRLPLV